MLAKKLLNYTERVSHTSQVLHVKIEGVHLQLFVKVVASMHGMRPYMATTKLLLHGYS